MSNQSQIPVDRHEVQLKDGRVFGIATYGDPEGAPVLALHGAPASRLMYEVADDSARARNLLLICPDRPGYGLSPVDEQPTLARRAEQLEAIADHLGLGRFALVAVSGGAPYAVALASRLGERITAMALVSPMGPIADMYRAREASRNRDLPRSQHWFFTRLPRYRRALGAAARIAAGGFRISPKISARAFSRLLPAADAEILRRPHVQESLIRMTQGGLRQGVAGGLADLQIFSQPWEVDFSAVRARTVLWQGTEDSIVPVKAALWLGGQLPDCSIEIVEGFGHYWIYDNIDAVLGRLARLIGEEDKGLAHSAR